MTNQKHSYPSIILNVIKDSVSSDGLVKSITGYYRDKFPNLSLFVFQCLPGGTFCEVLPPAHGQRVPLDQLKDKIKNLRSLSDLNTNAIFALLNFSGKPDYFFCLDFYDPVIMTDIAREFELYNCMYNSLNACSAQRESEKYNECANLVSHLTHDMSSLLGLMESYRSDTSLENKIHYMERLIPQILLYIREMELLRVSVPLDDLLDSIIQSQAHSERINLNSFDGDYIISCDVELINQAISEILANATRAGTETNHQVEITVSIRDSSIGLFPDQFVYLSITDHGPGIADEYVPLVFNPFFTTRKSEGSAGLGLAIAKKIVEAHGGDIHIDTSQNGGCTILVILPLETV